jgi:glycosyltransferase involved in cell wall biosynthesis
MRTFLHATWAKRQLRVNRFMLRACTRHGCGARYPPVIPLRVLVVATHIEVPGTGGGQTHVMELLAHLREHGEVLALTRRGSHGRGIVAAGLLRGLPPKGAAHALSVVNFARSLSAVRAFQPNVIYERGSSFGLGAMYSRLLDVPMLTMLLDEHISPLSLRRASHIICTNPQLVPDAFRYKAVKVSWGANTQRFVPGLHGAGLREKYGLSPQDFVVGYCGTFQKWHGVELLLDVAEQATTPMKFLMVGSRQRAAWFEALTVQRGLQESFIFTDTVPYPEVPEVLSVADVCVAPFDPTQHQGATQSAEYSLDPLKLFEYLALEKPVVTIDAENIRNLFDDGVHLRLIPPRNAAALLQTLNDFRANPDQAHAMAVNGRKRVEERHTWRAHAAHLTTLFQQMLRA